MQKISSIIAVMVVFVMLFASCTNEELVPNEPDGPVLNQGRVVFNVNTGKSMVYTRASKEDEQAIRSLGVFIVKPDGNLAEGITRFYEAKDMRDKKLAVSIPVDIMETSGVKAYLVANGPDKTQCDGLKTEQEVLGMVATTKPEEVSTKGIPMASGAISLNFTGGIATVNANMKRVMSTLCAKVVKSKGAVVGPSDFTFKVNGVSGKEGYCFKDECKDTGIEQVWNSTSKSQEEEVSLGYFYQSKKFQVEVISQSAGQSRTVEIPLEKAQTRNKKYVLKIHPKPASEGKGEFTVTVEAWDATETDVNFDKLSIKKDLPADKFEIQNDGIRLLTNNYHETDFGSPKDWFVLKEGSKIVNVKLEGTIDGAKRGVNLNKKGIACATPQLNQTDLSGKIIVTIEDKNGIITKEDYAIYVSHAYVQWNPNYSHKSDDDKKSFVLDGILTYTSRGDSDIENLAFSDIFLGKVIDVRPAFTLSSNPQEGVLFDSENKVVSGISFQVDVMALSTLRFITHFQREKVYTYLKVTATDKSGRQVNQILKVRFDIYQ